MAKIRTLLVTFMFFEVFIQNSKASTNNFIEVEEEYNKKINLVKLPNELIIRISSNIYGDDFFNFSLSSKNIYQFLHDSSFLFPPTGDEQFTNFILNRNFPIICDFCSRVPRNLMMNRLKNLCYSYENSHQIKELRECFNYYEKINRNFHIYFNLLKLEKNLGSSKADSLLTKLKNDKEYYLDNAKDNHLKNPKEYRNIFLYQWVQNSLLDKYERISLLSICNNEDKKIFFNEGYLSLSPQEKYYVLNFLSFIE